MNGPLNERFCLKNNRNNFAINFRLNTEDRAAYFGNRKINEEIINDIRDRYMMGNQPKKFLFGQYGVGKTHTLFNIKYQLEENPKAIPISNYTVKCCFVDTEFKEKTGYSHLHEQMMEAITLEKIKEVVQEYLQRNAGPNLQDTLRNDFGGNANIARAIQALGITGETITLWKWLCGGQLTNVELNSYNLTKNMDTIVEMYRVLVGIVRLFVKKGVYYLFLLDELEGLRNIRNQDCKESLHDAFRRLADDENDVVGFIVSIFAMREEEIPEFVFEADIKTRLNKANIHSLDYLNESDTRKFLKDLFALVIDDEKKKKKEKQKQIPSGLEYYPLTDAAIEEFLHLAISAPTACLPRNLISALNESAVRAAQQESYVIDTEHLAPAVSIFTEEF